MKKIVVASTNRVKLKAALNGFRKMFPREKFTISGVSVSSGVSDQPTSDAETFRGARNRALRASQKIKEADYYVGIEGGIQEKNSEMEVFAWIFIKGKSGGFGKGRTGTFFLPPAITKIIKQGKELGDADDIVFGRKNSKEKNGTVGLLTADVIDRAKYYTEAVVLALIPFKNKKYYPKIK